MLVPRWLGFDYELPASRSPEDLRDELEMLLSRLDRQVVIVIDDIDRLNGEEARAVFRLVGLCARMNNLVFVLSMDEEVLIGSLARRTVDGGTLRRSSREQCIFHPQLKMSWIGIFSSRIRIATFAPLLTNFWMFLRGRGALH